IRNSTNSIKVFEVYPNPTNGILIIKGSGIENGIYKLVLRNVIGQILFTDEINATNSDIEKTISISTLANDIYFLSIENTNDVMVKKILKKE
ncbi:MAG TPA: T9SS type A sorting domain-containing protein, partial [Chitinophagales bacterium]|nr:T9SS type A sorting domain-containing protein [Chitinophagales bacterium]